MSKFTPNWNAYWTEVEESQEIENLRAAEEEALERDCVFPRSEDLDDFEVQQGGS